MWPFKKKTPKEAPKGPKPLGKFPGIPGGAIGGVPYDQGSIVRVFSPLKEFQCDETGSVYMKDGKYYLREHNVNLKDSTDRWLALGLIKWL